MTSDDSENSFFWFTCYESKLYMIFVENLNDSMQNMLLKILVISFLNRTIQSKQFQSAADLIVQLNDFLSEKISLPNLTNFHNSRFYVSLVIADKKFGGIQFSGFNHSILLVSEDSVNKIDLSKISKFPAIENHFKNNSNVVTKPSTIYFLNSHALDFFESEGYLSDENESLKKYFSEISSYTFKEQEALFRKLVSKTESEIEVKREIKIIGISI